MRINHIAPREFAALSKASRQVAGGRNVAGPSVEALAELSPDATRQRKRAVRVTNGPSLGRKRPRRATTPRAGPAMSHRKSYGCSAPFSNAIFAELLPLNRRAQRRGLETRAFAASTAVSPGRKKGRSFAERPKSREETPKVGCGGRKVVSPPRNPTYDPVRSQRQVNGARVRAKSVDV